MSAICAIFFVIIILCGLSLTFSSCLKSADRKPKNRVELCNWLKESVTDGIEDSTQASSVEVYEWVYVAAGKLDSIHEAYKAEGLCDGDIDSARYDSEIIYPDELESVAYQTFGNEQYLLGGFFHEPYAVYVPKDIRMDGTHRKRFPESVMTKDGYANYWQLDGEWSVWLRVYFELWYFLPDIYQQQILILWPAGIDVKIVRGLVRARQSSFWIQRGKSSLLSH